MVSRKGGTGLFVSSKAPYEPLKPRAIQRMVRAISQRAGLEKRVHPHLLRHTFATHALLMAAWTLTVIQRLLGHEDVSQQRRCTAEMSGRNHPAPVQQICRGELSRGKEAQMKINGIKALDYQCQGDSLTLALTEDHV